MHKITPHSSRRAPPLKDSDYDHEIDLVDHADEAVEADEVDEVDEPRLGSSESEAGPAFRPSTTDALVPADALAPTDSSSVRSPPKQDEVAPEENGQRSSVRGSRGALEVPGS